MNERGTMQAEPKKRGPKSKAEKTAEALSVSFAAMADATPVEPAQEAPVVVHVAPVVPEPSIPLIDFIKAKERDFPPLVEITHPHAQNGGFHAGVYSGIRLKKGPCAAMYSDGTTE